MPKVSFRMASASRESVFGVQTNTARKIHRSDHTEGRLTTAPSGCCVRKGTRCGHSTCKSTSFGRREGDAYFGAEIGETGPAALRVLKRELDPAGIMKPGKRPPPSRSHNA